MHQTSQFNECSWRHAFIENIANQGDTPKDKRKKGMLREISSVSMGTKLVCMHAHYSGLIMV